MFMDVFPAAPDFPTLALFPHLQGSLIVPQAYQQVAVHVHVLVREA